MSTACSVGAVCSGPVQAADLGQQHEITWLAAGDSYASGQGVSNPMGPCARGTGKGGAGTTWAVAAANTLRANGYRFAVSSPNLVACSGAISDEFFHNHGALHGPQWTPAMGHFDLVTFSFGGNDIGFASILGHCILSGCPPDSAVRNKIQELGSTGAFKGNLHIPPFPIFLRDVANQAVVHGGNVVVMGYPDLFETPSRWDYWRQTCSYLDQQQVATARGWSADLNATLGTSVATVNAEAASSRNGVHFTFINPVDGGGPIPKDDPHLFEPSSGLRHELCSQGHASWLNGTSKRHPSHSFHPNQAGETAMGELAAETITQLTWPWSPGGTSESSTCDSLNLQLQSMTVGTSTFQQAVMMSLGAGCTAYVVDRGSTLYVEFLRGAATGQTIKIGLVEANRSSPISLSDIALNNQGVLYGVDFNADLFRINATTAQAVEIGQDTSVSDNVVNGLVFGPDGHLYASGGQTLIGLDATTGRGTLIGNTGFVSSGDLAFSETGRLYMTATGDELVSLNPTTGSATDVGPIGISNVFGLVSSGGTLFGTSNDGQLLSINPITASSVVIASGGPDSDGMATLPNAA